MLTRQFPRSSSRAETVKLISPHMAYKEDGFDGMYQIGELGGSHTAYYHDETDGFVIVWVVDEHNEYQLYGN